MPDLQPTPPESAEPASSSRTYADLPRLCGTYGEFPGFGAYAELAITTPDHDQEL